MSAATNAPPFDKSKLEELVIYVCAKSLNDQTFGLTKLNKLLFFCDFLSYAHLGKPITGSTYQRQQYGPVPAELRGVVNELTVKGDLRLVTPTYFTYMQKHYVALRRPVLDEFSGAEVALIDGVIEALRELDATSISDLSHQDVGWQIAEPGEDIPYESVYLSQGKPTREDIRWAQQLAAEYGWKDESPNG